MRRRRAEQKLREHRNGSGEPWRHGRHGGHGGCCRHLPSHRPSSVVGLFSTVRPLEAAESEVRWRQSGRQRRPASAPSSRSEGQRLSESLRRFPRFHPLCGVLKGSERLLACAIQAGQRKARMKKLLEPLEVESLILRRRLLEGEGSKFNELISDAFQKLLLVTLFGA